MEIKTEPEESFGTEFPEEEIKSECMDIEEAKSSPENSNKFCYLTNELPNIFARYSSSLM
uniref:Uncharacterized protein n=1 Tax=Megaselia scalaris TaxID=36166 RepID=T1GIY6_MEGSC